MPTITLLSDWSKGEYQPAVMACLLRYCPAAQMIEISRQIAPFSIRQASYLLASAWHHFPEGTVHLILVSARIDAEIRPMVVKAGNQFFVGVNNGILDLLFGDLPMEAYEIPVTVDDLSRSFPELYVLAPVAGKLASGQLPEEFLLPWTGKRKIRQQQPAYQANSISGTVLWQDSFGNLIVNIRSEVFRRVGRERPFRVFLANQPIPLHHLSQGYSDVDEGEYFAFFNDADFLEVGIRNGVSELFSGVQTGTGFSLFFDPPAGSNQ